LSLSQETPLLMQALLLRYSSVEPLVQLEQYRN
jgi:hypothetical protein